MVCTVVGGSCSRKEEMSRQLSSQERLSESSPLSESAYWGQREREQNRKRAKDNPKPLSPNNNGNTYQNHELPERLLNLFVYATEMTTVSSSQVQG